LIWLRTGTGGGVLVNAVMNLRIAYGKELGKKKKKKQEIFLQAVYNYGSLESDAVQSGR